MQDLIEVFPFTFQLVESASPSGKVVLEGICQRANIKNHNGRIYTKQLWEKVLNDPKIQQTISERKMLGHISHPASGKTDLAEASHVVTNVYLKGDDVIGRFELLPTPKGQILKALCEANIPLGVSSRAQGSLKDTPNGKLVNEADFNLVAWDVVADPSTPGAYPKPIYESVENSLLEEESMTSLDKLQLLENRSAALLSIKAKGLNAGIKAVTDKAIAETIIETTKLIKESPELEKLGNSLVEALVAKRKELSEETFGDADSGVVRVVPQEALPPPGEGGWSFDPSFAYVESDVEQMITSLVGEEKEEDEDDEEDDYEDEKDKKQEGEEKVEENKFVKLAQKTIKNDKAPKEVKAFAAAFLTEAKKRVQENKAFVSIVEKMQNKLDEAVKTGKIIVESDDVVAQKYQLATDVLKEVVRRYHLKEGLHYADKALTEANLAEDMDARKFVAEAIKVNGPKKEAIDEAIIFFSNIKSNRVSPTTTTKKELTEETETTPAPKDLPLTGALEGKVANLNESTNSSAVFGVNLVKRLENSFKGSRSNR